MPDNTNIQLVLHILIYKFIAAAVDGILPKCLLSIIANIHIDFYNSKNMAQGGYCRCILMNS